MKKLLQIFLLLLPVLTFSQKARFQFFTTADGLAGNNTSSVAQTDQGLLWLVNDGKIHRYDGYNFLIISPPDGLMPEPEPFIGLSAYQDSLLFIWSEHYPLLFNPKTENWKLVEDKETDQFKNKRFWQRLGAEEVLIKRVQTGTRGEQIWQLTNDQLSPLPLDHQFSFNGAESYWCDRDEQGNIYLASRDTFYVFDNSGKIKQRIPLSGICTNCYNLCFQFNAEGQVVLMTNWKFYTLIDGQFQPHPANRFLTPAKNHLHRFILDDSGSIWACGQDRNLIHYDAQQDTLFNFYDELRELLPNPNDFKGIFRDKTDILWIDTRLGLLKIRPQSYPFDNYFNELNEFKTHYSFRGFTEDVEGMVYGVFYDGIAKFDPEGIEPSQMFTFGKSISLFDLFEDRESVWLNGLEKINMHSGELTSVNNEFTNPLGDNGFFAMDANGKLWWASHYYLMHLDESNGVPEWKPELELSEKLYYQIEALHFGQKRKTLWISAKGRLLQYDPESRQMKWFDPKISGVSITRILAIEEDKFGKLWLATDEGLVFFDPDVTAVKHYTVENGLPNNFICGLLSEGDSCLWLSTNHGLSRFHISTESFINFYKEDGLTHNEFNRKSFFKARDGRMFFGGMQGVNGFFPDEVMKAYQERNKDAEIILSSFEYRSDNNPETVSVNAFERNSEIHLYYSDWSYTFEYVLTDFDNPDEIFYSYKMEGYKDNWSSPSKFNFTQYNSLPSGDYTFIVKARDSKGQWHPNQMKIKIVVHAPWWKTKVAYIMYCFLILLVFYSLRRYELNRQRLKHNLKFEKLEAERLKELDSFKSKLYTNLTHEFRTPLTVILGMVGQIQKDPESNLEEGTRLIQTNGENLLRLINQLLDLSKLESKSFQLHMTQSDIVLYLKYLVESFKSFANSKNLSLRFFTSEESFIMDYDPEQIKQILVNLISNALKFTSSGGEIFVRFKANEELVHIEVEDSGIGISEKDLPHVFDRFYQAESTSSGNLGGSGVGLSHTRELIKLMNGTVKVESEAGDGTCFTVSLPIGNEAPLADWDVGVLSIPGIFNMNDNKEISENKEAVVQDIEELPLLLIIEDNPDVVTYLKSCLREKYRVEVAYNGKIGIERALEVIPDLIISDVMMPEKDGFEVCDTLKNDDKTSHIPIIILTAKSDMASRIKGLKRGADVYLAKPFVKEELLTNVEMLLARQERITAHFSRVLKTEPVIEGNMPEVDEAIMIENDFLQKVQKIVEDNFDDEHFALPQLCEKLGMNRTQLFRKMKAVIDVSPSAFIRNFRLNTARKLLETTDLTVSEVAWKVGYKDLSHFSKTFQQAFGVSPSSVGK